MSKATEYMTDAEAMCEQILSAVSNFKNKYPNYNVYLIDDNGSKKIHQGLTIQLSTEIIREEKYQNLQETPSEIRQP